MKRILYSIIYTMAIISCATSKLETIRNSGTTADITLANESAYEFQPEIIEEASSDTLMVKGLDGEDLYLMKAIVDSAGNVSASETLQGVVITARFRNIAERHGKVDLAFDVHIPATLQDSKWQLRFKPKMYVLEDTLDLEDIYITGAEYRSYQLKGYEQYARFLSTIIRDSTELRYQHLLEIFIERNIPALASLKTDSSYVSDAEIKGLYDISYRQVLDYYEKRVKIGRNNYRSRIAPKKYNRYVKNPYSTDNIRLDSIITDAKDIIYCYTQTISTRPHLRKVDVTLEGEIMQDGKCQYHMPEGKPLTFYISSVSTFLEEKTRYITQIIERKAQANTHAYIDFEQGKWDINPDLHENRSELDRIGKNIISFVNNDTFDIDSLVITAYCSPEGSYQHNKILSSNRAESIMNYFISYAHRYNDSLSKEDRGTFIIDMTQDATPEEIPAERINDFSFSLHSVPEDWDKLRSIVSADTSLTDKEKLLSIITSTIPFDERERLLQNSSDYRYLREVVYPKLRTVQFDFHLHRKGMVKDTIHTTTIDQVYAEGLTALRERDYERAISILRPYNDINTAIAYLSMDYNASAKSILEEATPSAKRDYMLAIIYAREGKEKKAIQSYINSVDKDHSMTFRANLDPEISQLIKKYGITLDHADEEDIY